MGPVAVLAAADLAQGTKTDKQKREIVMIKKRITLIMMASFLVLSLVACGSSDVSLQDAGTDNASQTNREPSEESDQFASLNDETVTAASDQNDDEQDEEIVRPASWGEDTHSNDASPNYAVVFPQDEVNRLDITISQENWQAMLADMTSRYGEFGGSGQGRQNPGGGGGQNPGPGGGQDPLDGGSLEDDDSNPIWVPVTIEFEGDSWTNVGLRFKGNSSLSSTWSSGNLKLPFKLDFDEFEDEYAEIDDQRFYGFKQLTLASNFGDSSFLHEKVAADIFREAGVPAAQTAFYQVYVDYGEGPVYFGLYTMVEVVDDTVIETQFSDDSGNVYKPDGRGATFAIDTFSEDSFDKETNKDEADYSDILALYQALHAETRTTDPETWRAGLAEVFDVSGFLKYLAVNNVIQNWDTYGVMTHNYYLYNDPETGLLTWIPWDNNEAFTSGKRQGALSLSLDEVGSNWPLIRFLMDDPVYHAEYVKNVEAVVSGAFEPEMISARYQELHDLISPYVVGSTGEINGFSHLVSDAAFENSVSVMIDHAFDRYQTVQDYLESETK
jgi:hypothetical protein